MKPEYILMAVTIVVLFAAAVIVESIHRKKGRDGKDQRRIRDLAARMMGGAPFYTVVYANYRTGSLAVTHYASYIVAFRPMELFVIPIQFSGKEIIPQKGFFLNRENVGRVDFSEKPWVTFYGKDRSRLCAFGVFADNTAMNQFEPLDIQQQKETEQFQTFIHQFADSLSAAK